MSGPALKILHPCHQHGGALLSTIIGMGLVGLMAFFMATFFSNQFQSIKLVEFKGEQEDIRRHIRTNLNCAKTFATAACGNGFVPRDRKGRALSTDPASGKFGKYAYASKCQTGASGAKEINFEISHKSMASPQLIFKDLPFTCP